MLRVLLDPRLGQGYDDPSKPDPWRRGLEAVIGPAVRLLGRGDDGPAEVYVGQPDDARLDEPALRHVILPWAGIGVRLRERVASRPRLSLHNLHHNAEATAEMAVALLLAAARRIVPRDGHLRGGAWCGRAGDADPTLNDGPRTIPLDGGRCVVLGYGRIGQRVGAVCGALGMDVTGVALRARAEPVDGVPVVAGGALLDAARGARALIVTCPATPATEGLVDRRVLEAMGPRSVVVNVGRGPVIDEDALYRSLTDGTTAAAGLDVWWVYPRAGGPERVWPGHHPFDRLDHCVLSPHTGGAHGSPELEPRRARALSELLSSLARGEMANLVDLREGY